jgi:hypothetical protein
MQNNPFPDDFGDVDRMQKEYTPDLNQRLPGPDLLPDGTYRLAILEAELTKTQKNPETIFRLKVRVLQGPEGSAGAVIERATFFRQVDSMNRLGGELVALGLDADKWGKRGPTWSQECLAACPKLKGVQCAAYKTTTKAEAKPGVEAKTYHNLYINGRIGGAPVPPPAQEFNEFRNGSSREPANTQTPTPTSESESLAPAGGKIPW